MKIKKKLMLSLVTLFGVVIGLSALFIISSIRQGISDQAQLEMESTNALIANLLQAQIDNTIKTHLQTIADGARDMTAHYYQRYQDGALSEEEALQRVRSLILDPAYGKIGKDGYLAGVNGRGVLVIHPLSEGVDASGYPFMQQAIAQKNGFIQYEWQNAQETTTRQKVGGLAYFEPWDLLLWASSYKEDFRSLINFDAFRQTIAAIRLGKSGYLSVVDRQGKYIIHPSLEGQNGLDSKDADGRPYLREICEKGKGAITYRLRTPGGTQAKEQIAYYTPINYMDWIVISSVPKDELFALLSTINRILGATVLVALVISLLLSQLLANSFAGPIIALKKFSEAIIRGDYFQQAAVGGKDEIGDLAQAFNTMSVTIRQNFAEIIEQKKSIEDYNKNLERKVEVRTRELQDKNQQITDSIQYAKTIQHSILPDLLLVKKYVPESFVLWKPRDIVGGDFYWFSEATCGNSFIALVDCTGHSVPGAFVSMMVYSFLDSILDSGGYHDPAAILNELNSRLQKALHQEIEAAMADVGLDIGLCLLNPAQRQVVFSGAKLSLFCRTDDEVREIKGDRHSIGYKVSSRHSSYRNQTIPLNQDEVLYLTSDGYLDQKGAGERDFSFGKARFTQLIREIKDQPLSAQKAVFESRLQQFMGDEEQRDDITVIGFTL